MTTPPLLRPPGSSHKAVSPRHKLPSLKIETPLSSASSETPLIPSSDSSSSTSCSLESGRLSQKTHSQVPSLTTPSRKAVFNQLKLSVVNNDSTGSADLSTPVRVDNSSLSHVPALTPPNFHDKYRRSSESLVNSNTTPTIPTAYSTESLVADMGTLGLEPTDEAKEQLLKKSLDEITEHEWKDLFNSGLIETLEVLGEGNGGSVKKCNLKGTNHIFALKTITADPSPEFQKQIVRELNYNRRFKSPYIVSYYGTFYNESSASISICMEYMGGKSLDAIYQKFKENKIRVGEKALGKMAEGVLRGLSYLNQQKIMHRDIKPQNILLDSMGNVKLCDFGVSGEVVNSLATTFTGTSFYMAPERIRNEPYTITCDVWSLGLTLLEGAMGYFPFASQDPSLQISPIELLLIILEFEPQLKDEPQENIVWSASFKNFLQTSLTKDNRKRPSPRQMLEHPWMRGQISKKVRMDKLVHYCWGENI